ncbi:MAG: hypothetical protein U0586_08385 [Candidatus Brocadiaceae bacterium]
MIIVKAKYLIPHSIEKGVRCCVEAGTTTVADIAHTEHSFSVLKNHLYERLSTRKLLYLRLRIPSVETQDFASLRCVR